MSASVAVAAASLIAATATEAVAVNAAANARTGLVGAQNSLVTQVRFTPRGFRSDGMAAITRRDGAWVARLDGITARCLLACDGNRGAIAKRASARLDFLTQATLPHREVE
jgi:hypothetical protein